MKKVISVLAVILTLGLLLPACATGTATPGATTATPPRATTAAPTTTAPRTTVAPTPTSVGSPIYGGTLKFSTGASPVTLIPETNTLIQNVNQRASYDTLLKMDENGELQPNLATEWKLTSDKKSLTLTLRKGVKFHDGTDFNAAAVKYNIEIRKAAKLGDYEMVTSVDVVDDYTARINVSEFRNDLLTTLWFIGGMMHSPTARQADGKEKAMWHPVGTGPFKFISYDVGQVMKFTRFDGYWQKGKPYLDNFQEDIIADNTVREMALRSGQINAAETLEAKNIAELGRDGWTVVKGPVNTYYYLIGDTVNADSPYSKLKVRQALEYAIDRPAVAKALGYGLMEPLTQMTPDSGYAFTPGLTPRAYDPAKAKQLLADAGYPNGFKTTFVTLYRIADTLVATQTNLKTVGIDGTIDVCDVGRFYTLIRTGGWKNGLIYRTMRMTPDWLAYLNSYLSSSSIENKSFERTTEFQNLLDAAMTAPDTASKKTASQAVVKKIYDEALVAPLWGSNETIVHAKDVHNLEYYVPWGRNKLWSPADTWISK